MESKKKLRKSLKNLRKKESKCDKKRYEVNIFKKIIKLPCYTRSKFLAIYIANENEISTSKIFTDAILRRKKIFVPKINNKKEMVFVSINKKTKLTSNLYGIMEPISGKIIDPRRLDLVITPLLGFDKTGTRLGMGGGYYDKYFHFLRLRYKWFKPKLLGVGLEKQQIYLAKKDAWDINLFKIVTETNIYNFK